MINQAKHVPDYNTLHTLYCSLILPYLTYCVEVWGNNYNNSLQSLIILQKKRAIRTIHKAEYLEHKKIQDHVKFSMAQLLFKAFHNLIIYKSYSQRERERAVVQL